jgi:hypothetical protein
MANTSYPPDEGGTLSTLPPDDHRAASRTETAKEGASEVADTAKQGIADVAQEATQQARAVAHDARDHARDLMGQATTELRSHAGDQAQRAAGGLEQLATRLGALVAGRPEEAGPLRDYAEQLGDRAQQAAEHLRSRGVDGVLTDVRSFAQRRPGLFLAGAAAAGFAIGRLVKAERSDADQTSSGSPTELGRRPAYGAGLSGPGVEPVYGTASPVLPGRDDIDPMVPDIPPGLVSPASAPVASAGDVASTEPGRW